MYEVWFVSVLVGLLVFFLIAVVGTGGFYDT